MKERGDKLKSGRLLVFGVMIALLAGCVSSPLPKKHSRQSDEIKTLMRQLNTDMQDNYNSELQKDDMRVRYAHRLFGNLIGVAGELDQKFEEELYNGKITLRQKEIYLLYVGELRQHARMFEQIGSGYETEKMGEALRNLDKTCTSCHAELKANP
jgi:hypothetical protein